METNSEQTKAPIRFKPGNKYGNRFKPGESGNPSGRPAGSKNVSTILREMLQQIAPKEVISSKFVKEFCKGKKRVTIADAIAARLLMSAIVQGDLQAIREVIDRLEGKSTQKLDVDMQVNDWRQMAEAAGISEADVISEAEQLLKSFDDPGR
jgi:hypothetical protein